MTAVLNEPLGWVLRRELTEERLISLPDRFTLEVGLGSYRPAMTTPCADDQLPDNQWAWWRHWLEFIFEDRGAAEPVPAQLVPVMPPKYKAMAEQDRPTSQYRRWHALPSLTA